MISYRIDVADPRAHLYGVTLTVPAPAAEQRLAMPAWIPGSYLIREFGRHVSGFAAQQRGTPVPWRQIDKATWRAVCDPLVPLVVRYRVYAFDTSVRAAFLDASRGFFNATSLCMRVEGRHADEHRLELSSLPFDWKVATTLPVSTGPAAAPGLYAAAGYDELADHPVELGRFWRGSFVAKGVPHDLVVAGALPDFDGERLLADTRRICEQQIAFWHADGRPPFERYLFMLNAVEDGHGGLEHRSSTALLAPRRDLPRIDESGASGSAAGGAAALDDGYVGVLGLASHEYFHAWNVKRLRPRDFTTLDYARENYTELLWFFEGHTSYYDDLFLLRAGLIDEARYLGLLAKTASAVVGVPGGLVQSVAEASFDAWVKYYRADENTPNATISYYAKGALVALAFDLTLRREGRGSLDDVMRRVWTSSGGGPVDEHDIAAALEAVGGRSYAAELAAWVHGTAELPLEELLRAAGVGWQWQPATLAQRLGVRVAESALTGVKVTHVLHGGAAERIGVSAGDEILAIGGWRARRLDDALRVLPASGEAPFLVARDQRVLELTLALPLPTAARPATLALKADADASPAALALRKAWFAG